MDDKLTHLDNTGRAQMVDVGNKPDTDRVAVARGEIVMRQKTLKIIRSGSIKKGDVLTVAQLAGVMAAKNTSDMIPLCHPLRLTNVQVDLELDDDLPGVQITATVRTVAALTIYDMAKAVEKTMLIRNIRLVEKRGGQSGEVKNE